MIEITRALAHRVRAVFQRALCGSRRVQVWLRLVASADGLRIQAVHDQVAIEYHLAGPLEPDELILPLEVLAACESKNSQDLVRFRKVDDEQVLSPAPPAAAR